MEENTPKTEESDSTNGHRSFRGLTTSIAYAALAIVIFGILTAVVGVVSPAFVAVIPAFALVFVTAVLVAVTNNYVTATDELVAEQKKMLSTQNNQLTATTQLVSAEEAQAQAINSEVGALTDPILLVDMQVIQRATRRAGVFVPVALEVFIQNLGPGEAFDIKFTEIDDFTYYIKTGDPTRSSSPKPQKFSELKIMKHGMKRLAPQQRKTLARIVLDDNNGDYLGRSTHPVSITCQKRSSPNEIRDSFTLDFPYYLELINLLHYEANVAMKYVA
jgi:hypothetical protein